METAVKPYAFSRKVFCEGMRDGVPIALGYFAVSFSLGIALSLIHISEPTRRS